MIRRVLSFIKGYLFSLAANLLALALTHFLSPLLVPNPFPIFVATTALVAWFFGVGVGIFSALVATLVTNFFFQPPLFLLTLGKEDISRLGLFLLVTAIAVSLMRAQKVAAEVQSHLGAIVAFSQDAIIGLTLDGKISSWNSGAERIYGYPASEMIGSPVVRIVSLEQQAGITDILEILARMQSGQSTQPYETVHAHKSGARIDTSITISPIRGKGGEIRGASMIARDITAQKQAEKKVQEYTDQLQFLSQSLVEVQENERRFIARELHDEFGQILTGLKLIMEVIPRLPPETLAEKLAQAQGLVTELIERVSRLTLDLRPPMLDDLGLLPTLLWHFNRYTSTTGIQVIFKHTGLEKQRFSAEIETAVYRIIQEALTNAARHAVPSQVKVWVVVDPQELSIQVQDDGQGFDSQSILISGKASGLVGIRERAEILGGTLSIHTNPGQGTNLEVELPLAPSRNRISQEQN
jgi:PAS domain S-box-containing protein